MGTLVVAGALGALVVAGALVIADDGAATLEAGGLGVLTAGADAADAADGRRTRALTAGATETTTQI